jgi:hypothetical protein
LATSAGVPVSKPVEVRDIPDGRLPAINEYVMAVESLVFASSCSENADCSSIDASFPAVVVHTGVAIKILLTWIFIGVSTIYSVRYSMLLTINLQWH